MCAQRNIIPHPQRAPSMNTHLIRAQLACASGIKKETHTHMTAKRTKSRRWPAPAPAASAAAGNRIRFTRECCVSSRSCNMQSTLHHMQRVRDTAPQWCIGWVPASHLPRPRRPAPRCHHHIMKCTFGRDPISTSLSTPRGFIARICVYLRRPPTNSANNFYCPRRSGRGAGRKHLRAHYPRDYCLRVGNMIPFGDAVSVACTAVDQFSVARGGDPVYSCMWSRRCECKCQCRVVRQIVLERGQSLSRPVDNIVCTSAARGGMGVWLARVDRRSRENVDNCSKTS